MGLSVAITALVLPPVLAGGAALAALATGLGMGCLARRQIGGYTGDVLGATAVACECVVLGLLSANAVGR